MSDSKQFFDYLKSIDEEQAISILDNMNLEAANILDKLTIFENEVEKALDVFHEFWKNHPLDPVWHEPLMPLLHIYKKLKDKNS